MSTIADNIALVSSRIRAAALAAHRDEHSVQLLAVSKTKPAEALREAHAAGLRDFGENYLQEALSKQLELADLPALAKAISELPRIKLRGLMAIPEPTEDRAAQDAAFAAVQSLQASLNLPLDTLSMGMSHDLESAIAQGATWVRIGTALFGARDYSQS